MSAVGGLGPRRLDWNTPAPTDFLEHLHPEQEPYDMADPETISRPEQLILEDLTKRQIPGRTIARRRHRTYLESLENRGLITLDEWPNVRLTEEVSNLVALGVPIPELARRFPARPTGA